MLSYVALIKIYPAFMLVYFIVRRQWKVIEGCVYGGLFFVLLSVSLFGWQEHFYYLTVVLPVLLHEAISLQDTNLNLVAALKGYLVEGQLHLWFQIWGVPFVCVLLVVCLRKRTTAESPFLLISFVVGCG